MVWSNWPWVELQRAKPKDLPSAITIANSLVDFRPDWAPADLRKEKGKANTTSFQKNSERPHQKEEYGWWCGKAEKLSSEANSSKSYSGCFTCQRPHRARDCPKKEKLNPLVIEEDNSDSDGGPSRVNPLQLVNAIKTENGDAQKDLMYATTLINGKTVPAMMDTGASHNFIAKRQVPLVDAKLTLEQDKDNEFTGPVGVWVWRTGWMFDWSLG